MLPEETATGAHRRSAGSGDRTRRLCLRIRSENLPGIFPFLRPKYCRPAPGPAAFPLSLAAGTRAGNSFFFRLGSGSAPEARKKQFDVGATVLRKKYRSDA